MSLTWFFVEWAFFYFVWIVATEIVLRGYVPKRFNNATEGMGKFAQGFAKYCPGLMPLCSRNI